MRSSVGKWEMKDDLVERLRAETDGATVNPDGLEAADRIEELEKRLAASDKQIKELWCDFVWSVTDD